MAVQDYIDHVLNALPKWFSNRSREFENVKAFAEIFQAVEDQAVIWRSQANILTAVGAVTDEPDWLAQHAHDRDTRRQENETDVALRERLRTFSDALLISVLLTAAQAIVDAEGIVGTVAILELRPNRAFMAKLDSGGLSTGGTFIGTAPNMSFVPDAGLIKLNPKYDSVANHQFIFSGSNSAGNDGTFQITGVLNDGGSYQNGSGVAEVDATVDWTLQRLNAGGEVLDAGAKQQSYFSRGYRLGSAVATLVVMLPFGCTEATRLSVIESFRTKKGAGVRVLVECRTSP